MKKILLAAALAACATSAFAEPTAVLKVKGLLTNASCTPSLSNNGTINYGQIPLNTLSATEVNQIGHGNIDFTIECASATKVSWSFIDAKVSSRADIDVMDATMNGSAVTAYSNTRFGVGTTAGGVKIGNYAMYIDTTKVTANGDAVNTIWASSKNGAIDWGNYTDANCLLSGASYYTVAVTGSKEPLPITKATFPLVSSLAIQNTDTLALTDNTDINGQLTISLNYL